jgi:ribose transport system permease protein
MNLFWKKFRLSIVQYEEIGIAGALIVVFLVFGIANPAFVSSVNIMRLLRQACILGIMAIGTVYVISANGIDISVGAILAVSSTIVAQSLLNGSNVLVSIGLALLVSVLLGAVNGLIVTKLGVKELIATFATAYIIRGLLLQISGAKWLTNLPKSFTVIGQGNVFGIPVPAFILAGVLIAAYIFSNHTPLGKQVKAVGGNEEASRLSGISMTKVKILTFSICGFCTGIAGVVYAARMGSVQSNAGVGMEFDVISAAMIGGANFNGEGSPVGALLGALLLTAIKNGLVILGFSSFFEGVVTGALILVALVVNMLRSRYQNSLEVTCNE